MVVWSLYFKRCPGRQEWNWPCSSADNVNGCLVELTIPSHALHSFQPVAQWTIMTLTGGPCIYDCGPVRTLWTVRSGQRGARCPVFSIMSQLCFHYGSIMFQLWLNYASIMIPLWLHYVCIAVRSIMAPLWSHYGSIILPLCFHYGSIMALIAPICL